MPLPMTYDCRKGIRNWLPLGNIYLGDCVVAAWLHLTMVHNLAVSSTWKKLLYRVGFRPPSNAFAKADYAAYLATVGEVPSGTAGIDPNSFFPWLVSTGKIKDWSSVSLTPGSIVTSIEQACVDGIGCMLTLNLTRRAYNSTRDWVVEPGDTPDPSLGHAIADVVYNPEFHGVVTWGSMKSASVDFLELCVTGCYIFS